MNDELNLDNNAESKDEVQLNPLEVKAAEKGWRPLDDWQGDPDEWRSAKEFLDRESFFDKIKNQNKQIKELTTTLNQLAEHQSKVAKNAREETLRELKAQKKIALEEQDVNKVMELDDQIATVTHSPDPQPVVVAPSHDTEFDGFKERNPWYEKDSDLTETAQSLATAWVLKKNGTKENWTFEELYDYVENKMNKLVDKADKRNTKSPVLGSPNVRTSNASKPKSKFTEKDLNETQLQIGKTFVRAKAHETLQEYIDVLASIGELK